MIDCLARNWEHFFDRFLPGRLQEFMVQLVSYLSFFEADMRDRAALKQAKSHEYAMDQIGLLEANLEDATSLMEII
jgi:hypothetical protein